MQRLKSLPMILDWDPGLMKKFPIKSVIRTLVEFRNRLYDR